jgi:hypothetical protein
MKRILLILFSVLFVSAALFAADPPNGIVGWWKLNETEGTATDSSASGLTGTLVANAAWDASGKVSNCILLDGDTDCITANAPANKGMVLIRLKDCTLGFQNASGGQLRWDADVDTGVVDYIYDFALSAWYFVGVTQTGTTYCLYINNSQVATGETDALDLDSAVNVVIGAYNATGTMDFGGRIDDVRIYNRVLSPTEMLWLYNNPEGTEAAAAAAARKIVLRLLLQ